MTAGALTGELPDSSEPEKSDTDSMQGLSGSAIATVLIQFEITPPDAQRVCNTIAKFKKTWSIPIHGIAVKHSGGNLVICIQVVLGSLKQVSERHDNSLAGMGLLSDLHRYLEPFNPVLVGQPLGVRRATIISPTEPISMITAAAKKMARATHRNLRASAGKTPTVEPDTLAKNVNDGAPCLTGEHEASS